ncbi:dTDP-4-dehydrorhamnose reductase [Flavobacterium sp.]|jgi:dTDP-4-dehydrorhamnose reductase|uniref:dTDP-4-dehydrorhamnose reductase n=1 Tax=Flavobacterium sp. TaxID=239 RepID=UPI0037BEB849
MVVLVTGANGQLGQAIQSVVGNYPSIDFVFCSSSELNITDKNNCETIFEKYKPQFCINAAAYTAVDKAESEQEKAYAINVTGAQNLAAVCKLNNTTLLHVSTDFVFDGLATQPYSEEAIPNPTGVYGVTKLQGEQAIQNTLEKHFIIRTSWVYSQFANNFMKTMLRLASERESLSVVSDQIGTPTNAVDLAECILNIITFDFRLSTFDCYGIYNFSNEGQCSWYDFAKEIFKVHNISINLQPIPTTAYPTPAKRPAYSVLDKSKIKQVFSVEIKSWQDSLKRI